jgi:hypothetical protein
MNILGWQLPFGKKHGSRPSRLAAVLPRVRAMRESCDWAPSASSATIEGRKHRLASIRKRITYRPLPHDTVAESTVSSEWARRLWLGVPTVLLIAGIVWIVLVTERSAPIVSYTVRYQLPSAPPFLSEQLALTKAQEALAQRGLDTNVWTPVKITARKGSVAPDGTRDDYLFRTTPGDPNSGEIYFGTSEGRGPERTVDVQLQGNQVLCTVSTILTNSGAR